MRDERQIISPPDLIRMTYSITLVPGIVVTCSRSSVIEIDTQDHPDLWQYWGSANYNICILRQRLLWSLI